MKTAMQELINLLEFNTTNEPLPYLIDVINEVYISKEKEQYLDLIRFMRINDKMGKTVEDLYNEFINQNK